MAKGKVSSKSEKDRYTRYKTSGLFAKNKARKIARHAKKHPNDAVALKALARGNFSYSRKTPKSSQWSKSEKTLVTLIGSYLKRPTKSAIPANS